MRKKELVVIFGVCLDLNDKECPNEDCGKKLPVVVILQNNHPIYAFSDMVVIFDLETISRGETTKKCPCCGYVYKIPCLGEPKLEGQPT